MIILRRVEFKKARVGRCGQTRCDSITPVGYDADFVMFKKEAHDIMKNYEHPSYDGAGDEYSIEYFKGNSTDQNFREDGQSVLKFILEGKEWKFYEHEEFKFSVADVNKLIEIWRL